MSKELVEKKDEEIEELKDKLGDLERQLEEMKQAKEAELKKQKEEQEKASKPVEVLGLSKKQSEVSMAALTSPNLRKKSVMGIITEIPQNSREVKAQAHDAVVNRRGEISAEIMKKAVETVASYRKVVTPKTEEVKRLIQTIVEDNMLFFDMEPEARLDCVDAFTEVTVPKSQVCALNTCILFVMSNPHIHMLHTIPCSSPSLSKGHREISST